MGLECLRTLTSNLPGCFRARTDSFLRCCVGTADPPTRFSGLTADRLPIGAQ